MILKEINQESKEISIFFDNLSFYLFLQIKLIIGIIKFYKLFTKI